MTASDSSNDGPTVRRSRGISAVWLIPILAVVLGFWLVYTTLEQQGPTITIEFATGAGIEAGKTNIKLRDIVVGTITGVSLADDLETVIATAEMVPETQDYLTEGTRFWVVQPEVGFERVTGLSTLLAGVHIAMEPGAGDPARRFEGLLRKPPVPREAPGRRYVLAVEQLGALRVGSPVYFREIRVGEVTGFRLTARPDLADGELVCPRDESLAAAFTVETHVTAPYDELVLADSHFFNASGAALSLTGQRVQLELRSISALLGGAVAIDSPGLVHETGAVAPDCATFLLYADEVQARTAATERGFIPLLLYFDDSLAGLQVGAPVTFRGIAVGQVLDIDLRLNVDREDLSLPVKIEIFNDAIELTGAAVSDLEDDALAEFLVDRGLRARLATTNVLTGALEVQLDFYADVEPATIAFEDGLGVLPTIPSTLAQLEASVQGILDKLAGLPLETVSADLGALVASAQELLASPELPQVIADVQATGAALRNLAERVDREADPLFRDARAAMASAREALSAADTAAENADRLSFDAEQLLRELRAAARAIRTFAEYLERNPEALIQGRQGR